MMIEEATRMSLKIIMAAVRRTGDVGIDLPAGASAAALGATDYRPVDMEPAALQPEAVQGCDLPAGRSAKDLRPEDYRPFVTEHAASPAGKSARATAPNAATTSAR
jgi:hypothetical protein